ncbi:alpha-xylosidase [Cohnella terricola]|uniref:Alpha-xylosidase n=1 Tax=Cohnella terricola TaxID=1289167 RepID=A0A559JA42_9BACL|nr:TIM-barrel domain-containing protein [Cohnella terricola]TVX96707.1 alpha-xylosidase [Cohnella terricola]
MMSALNQPIDRSEGFDSTSDTYFFAAQAVSFDADSASGTLQWRRYLRKPRLSFNQIDYPYEESPSWAFPDEYEDRPTTPFGLSFLSERTVRIRIGTRPGALGSAEPTLMLDHSAIGTTENWESRRQDNEIVYSSAAGSITVQTDPWKLIIRDANGSIVTETRGFSDGKSLLNTNGLPFSFRRSSSDFGNNAAASFLLRPDEKLYGTGESFTRLNKRGQKINLFTTDALSAQTAKMYKPVPFFLSSRGYGLFVHTSSPLTMDFGSTYDDTCVVYTGDEELDLFLFIGSPQEIVSEYTRITGRSALPPLWSFGLWMSRITYSSEEEVREVARQLQLSRIPCDVIHLDTGWFEKDWRCNYRFSEERFDDPERMIQQLREMGYRVSLWQLPYFTPTNPLYASIIENGFAVRTAEGALPTDDAILDYSNPAAVTWYQDRLAELLRIGVSAIKVDFGEAAPLNGQYSSGKSGYREHNLYPLRYNKAVAEVTEAVKGESIIWARSAWAGSQRYPIHWGGDAENTDGAMAATLRGGLSLGLCGFSFWSHDIGGFVHSSPEELYRRWLPFGMLTSHSRCHGAPPTEPWAYGERFTDFFRRTTQMKYELMPYIYTQAKLSADRGHPMLRALFFEFPEDPGSWLIEDQYMFGSELLVAPMFEEGDERDVYLPPGEWVDYQTGIAYPGGRWQRIAPGELPIVILVKSGAVIPHMDAALSTSYLDWSDIRFVRYGAEASVAENNPVCPLYEPFEQTLYRVTLTGDDIQGIYNSRGILATDKEGWRVARQAKR